MIEICNRADGEDSHVETTRDMPELHRGYYQHNG
jgi:hypothetical protein